MRACEARLNMESNEFFVDSGAARFGVIKGYSPSRSSALATNGNAQHSGAFASVDMVPSTSNLAQSDAEVHGFLACRS